MQDNIKILSKGSSGNIEAIKVPVNHTSQLYKEREREKSVCKRQKAVLTPKITNFF